MSNKIAFVEAVEMGRKSRTLASKSLKGKQVVKLVTWEKDDNNSRTSSGSLGCWLETSNGEQHWANLSEIIQKLNNVPGTEGLFEVSSTPGEKFIILDTDKTIEVEYKDGKLISAKPTQSNAKKRVPTTGYNPAVHVNWTFDAATNEFVEP